MGIGRPPEFIPLLEHTDILVMSWGGTVPMMAHAVASSSVRSPAPGTNGVTDTAVTTAKGVINLGEVAAIHVTINGMFKVEPPDLQPDGPPPWACRSSRGRGPSAKRRLQTSI